MKIEKRGSLPAGIAPGRVQLRAVELERMEAFYHGLLGLEVLEPDGEVRRLGAGGRELLRLAPADPDLPRFEGLYHFCLLAKDRVELARWLRRLADASWPLGGLVDHHTSEAIYLEDPEGNGVELNWDRPEEQWPSAMEEVARRGNGPLDVEGLMGLLEEKGPSNAAAADTRVSHLHLHTVSLADSEIFYHGQLGLDVVGKFGAAAEFTSAGGYHHHVAFNTWKRGLQPRQGETQAGLDWFSLGFEDGKALLQARERLGGGDGIFRDPVGNGLVLEARVQST